MKTKIIALALLAGSVIGINSCTTVQGVPSAQQERELTVGIVQREIKKGMSGAEVAEALGSPNIVTKDAAENEVWTWDKIATEVTQSESSSGWFVILAGGSSRTASASMQQKTLTIVITFDTNGKVEKVTYHQSRF